MGKSTFTHGFAVPRHFEAWIGAPEKGRKRHIILVFDGTEASVTLRTLANGRGQVQVRYDNFDGKPFREWLSRTSAATLQKICGEYFELSKCGSNRFQVNASSLLHHNGGLVVAEWIFHRGSEQLLDKCPSLREVMAVVRDVQFAAILLKYHELVPRA